MDPKYASTVFVIQKKSSTEFSALAIKVHQSGFSRFR